jgi:hypothetical protein
MDSRGLSRMSARAEGEREKEVGEKEADCALEILYSKFWAATRGLSLCRDRSQHISSCSTRWWRKGG